MDQLRDRTNDARMHLSHETNVLRHIDLKEKPSMLTPSHQFDESHNLASLIADSSHLLAHEKHTRCGTRRLAASIPLWQPIELYCRIMCLLLVQVLVRVESARNVRAADAMGTSDPFVKVCKQCPLSLKVKFLLSFAYGYAKSTNKSISHSFAKHEI